MTKVNNIKFKTEKKEMELIRVLNKNGEFTGKVMNKDVVHEKNLFHEEIGLFILRGNNQILLQQRSANKKI